ncbi:hypothetical protein ABPG74_020178 [Tetrahymena malaccensis]
MEITKSKINKLQIQTVIACGKPGVGKSSLGNHLLTKNPKSDLFVQKDDPSEFGITKDICSKIKEIAYDGKKMQVQYVDLPGCGDPTIDTKKIYEKMLKEQNDAVFNCALLLISSQDNRLNYQEMMCCNFYKSFFKSRNDKDMKESLWLIITRCQEHDVTDEWVQSKLKGFEKLGLLIDPTRVIRYKQKDEDLIPLFQYMVKLAYDGLVLDQDVKKCEEQFIEGVAQNSVDDQALKQQLLELKEMVEALEMMQNVGLITKILQMVHLKEMSEQQKKIQQQEKERQEKQKQQQESSSSSSCVLI